MSTEEKTLWVAYTNSDLTEGRGHQIPIACCELEVTARRLAKRRGPMGSDGHVGQARVHEFNGRLYVPYDLACITPPSPEDKALHEKQQARAAAIAKAKAAGLSEADIKLLSQ